MNKQMMNLLNVVPFCMENRPYDCGQWVIDPETDMLYRSKQDDNMRHIDDNDAWYEFGRVAGLLDFVVNDSKKADLELPYYPECAAGCVPVFNKGDCVVDRVGAMDEN
jgi:hypothetical protein